LGQIENRFYLLNRETGPEYYRSYRDDFQGPTVPGGNDGSEAIGCR